MKENLCSIFLCILFLATGSGFCNAQYVTIWDREVKAIRDNVIPDFTLPYGDYTQYVPGVSVFALKCAGVESRSEWGDFSPAQALQPQSAQSFPCPGNWS